MYWPEPSCARRKCSRIQHVSNLPRLIAECSKFCFLYSTCFSCSVLMLSVPNWGLSPLCCVPNSSISWERERVDSNALKVQSSHGHRLLQQWVWSIQESLGKHGQSPGIKGVWWDRRRCNVATCCYRIAQMHTDATCCKTLGRALPWLNCCRTARSTRFFTKSAAFSKPCPRSSTPSASS